MLLIHRLGSARVLFLLFATWIFVYPSAQANVVANGPQNFNTVPDGLDFLTVQSSKTLQPGVLNLGLFFNYAVNSLPYNQLSGQSSTGNGNGILGMDFNVALGILTNWEISFSMPSVLSEYVNSSDIAHGQFTSAGVTEFRPSTKVRVVGDEVKGIALIGSLGINDISGNPYTGTSPGPEFTLEAAGSTRTGAFDLGLNVGYRWMDPGTAIPNSFILPLGNQWIASAAVSYLIPESSNKIIFELFGSLPASDQGSDTNRLDSSLEALVGLKHDISQNFAYQVGLGGALINGVSSPDVRVYAGVNYALGPIFEKSTVALEKVETPAPAPVQERFIIHDITFEYDSTEMTGDYQRVLSELAKHLSEITYSSLTVVGYTDSLGSVAYNQKLSERRANAIRNYLIAEFHISPEKITAEGRGPADPLADNGNFQGRLQNRRVEFNITR